jgi:hypothetical protein
MISSSAQNCKYIGKGFEANGIDSLSVVCRGGAVLWITVAISRTSLSGRHKDGKRGPDGQRLSVLSASAADLNERRHASALLRD